MEWTHAIRPFAAINDKNLLFGKIDSWEVDLNVLIVSLQH
jgi:hypothetical protein